ncbi:MAG TPA: O-antigen ligase family protein, partial [Phormidium sp.]
FHPDPQLQFLWNMFGLGLLSFPVIPAVGMVLLSLSALATWWKKYRQIIRQPLTWGFAILTVLLVIVSSFGYYRAEAYIGLGNLIPQFIFFTSISALIQTPAQLRRISWILVISSIPVVIFGLVQLLLGWGTVGEVQSFLGLAIAPTGDPPGRMSANFMYANILAAYLTIVFILNLGLLIENFPQKRTTQSPIPSPQYQFLIVAFLGNAIALVLTNSRNGWAIAVFACLTFAVYLGWRWLIFIVSGISGIVLLSAFAPSPIREPFRKIVPYFIWARLSDEMFGDRPIPLLRSTQWNFAWSLTQERPLTGWGLRNFSPLYISKYSSYQMPIWLGHPHNLFLMLT